MPKAKTTKKLKNKVSDNPKEGHGVLIQKNLGKLWTGWS